VKNDDPNQNFEKDNIRARIGNNLRLTSIESPISRTVRYFDSHVPLIRDESFLATDPDGQVWAYRKRPVNRRTGSARSWGVMIGDPIPRFVGQADLGDVEWSDTLVDYGPDPKSG
jgi:hypothetical protein